MEIFEPLIICGSISLLLFAIGFLGSVINRVYEIDRLREENNELRKENSILRSVKGVVEE